MTDRSSQILATERLHFQTWRPDDLPLLYNLHADPRMQTSYAPGKNKWSMEAIERRLSGYMVERATHGFTKWKPSLADGTFIGRAG